MKMKQKCSTCIYTIHTCQAHRTIVVFCVGILLCYIPYWAITTFGVARIRSGILPKNEYLRCSHIGDREKKCHPAIWKFYLWCSFRTLWEFRMNGIKYPQTLLFMTNKRKRSLLLRSLYHNDEIIYTHMRDMDWMQHTRNKIEYAQALFVCFLFNLHRTTQFSFRHFMAYLL